MNRYKNTIEEGDTVILYLGFNKMVTVVVTKDKTHQTKFGAVRHNDLIGQSYGSKVKTSKGWLTPLHLTPELWTVNLPHRTQILYTADISMVTLQLELKPGSVVVESGTGSGSLSHAILRTVYPSGHLHTFDFHKERCETARAEFVRHGFGDIVTTYHRDVCSGGFGLEGVADAVFLDLPCPWDALPHAKAVLRREGGRLCSFSPCIEQVQRTCNALRSLGFHEVTTMECLLREFAVFTINMNVADSWAGYPDQMPGSEMALEREPPVGVYEMAGDRTPRDVTPTNIATAKQAASTHKPTSACGAVTDARGSTNLEPQALPDSSGKPMCNEPSPTLSTENVTPTDATPMDSGDQPMPTYGRSMDDPGEAPTDSSDAPTPTDVTPIGSDNQSMSSDRTPIDARSKAPTNSSDAPTLTDTTQIASGNIPTPVDGTPTDATGQTSIDPGNKVMPTGGTPTHIGDKPVSVELTPAATARMDVDSSYATQTIESSSQSSEREDRTEKGTKRSRTKFVGTNKRTQNNMMFKFKTAVPKPQSPGHTGFLTFATLFPSAPMQSCATASASTSGPT